MPCPPAPSLGPPDLPMTQQLNSVAWHCRPCSGQRPSDYPPHPIVNTSKSWKEHNFLHVASGWAMWITGMGLAKQGRLVVQTKGPGSTEVWDM